MIGTPTNLRLTGGVLKWDSVDGAHGYNIHSGEDYLFTVDNISQAIIPSYAEPPYSVSSWRKDAHGVSDHSPRSECVDGSLSHLFMPDFDLDKRKLIVDDRFMTLDNWQPEFPYWGPETIINNELQIYKTDAFELGEEGLVINAIKVGDRQWESGCLKMPIDRSFIYGYFEVEMQWDNHPGFLPAFWLLNVKYVDKSPEIDIFENPGFGRAHQTYHWWNPEHNRRSNDVPELTGFHRYAVDWRRESMTWLIDDEPVFHIWGDYMPDQAMYPIINLAVGGNWPGDPDPSIESAHLRVKSFKVWK